MILLGLQTLAAVVFVIVIFFPLMGKDYFATVLSACFAGFSRDTNVLADDHTAVSAHADPYAIGACHETFQSALQIADIGATRVSRDVAVSRSAKHSGVISHARRATVPPRRQAPSLRHRIAPAAKASNAHQLSARIPYAAESRRWEIELRPANR